MPKIVQINVNHSGAFQDLLLKRMEENGFLLAVISKVYLIPKEDYRWYGSENDPPPQLQ